MHASKTPLNYWALAVKPLSGTTDNEEDSCILHTSQPFSLLTMVFTLQLSDTKTSQQ